MNQSQSLPWYKQFWPWFLIALPASAVIASLYTVSLAVRTTDSLVTVADEGMDVVAERHSAAEQRAAAFQLSARLSIDTTSGAINASLDRGSMKDLPKSIELLMSHPTDATRDQTVILDSALPDNDGNPRFAGHFVAVPKGRWYVVFTPAEDDADQWRLNGVWNGQDVVRLIPASGVSDGRL